MTTSGIFFTYESQNDLDFLTSSLADSGLDEVILAVGGKVVLPNADEKNGSDKLTFILEKQRLGKTASYNQALSRAHGDLFFVVSGDVRFENSVFERCIGCLNDNCGMLIPRVVHPKPATLSEFIGGVMWNLHDSFMEQMETESQFFCGGEFQVVRSAGPIDMKDAVNDDEFLCHQVMESGKQIKYERRITVSNRIPRKLSQLMKQRVRVNYGHIQFKAEKGLASSMSHLGYRHLGRIFRVLLLYAKRYGLDILLLPGTILFELISVALARRDYTAGVNHSIWDLNSSSGRNEESGL